MNSKRKIYPVFLPHAGCPFQCVYCNQHAVTASFSGQVPQPEDLVACFDWMFTPLLDQALAGAAPGEIAFYGGTFTALPVPTLKALLERVTPWVQEGVFTGIRFSTRPDCMSREVCALLEDYPVRTVELGVQSLSKVVLQESRRGYGVEVVERAAALVHDHGWQLGVQLMLGLPGDSRESFLASVAKAVEFRPHLMRLYPTLVLEGTLLAEWHRAGKFRPLTLDEAVEWCASAYDILLNARIPIARLGLHGDPELEKPGRILAGPYHPAFGYLVRVRRWRESIDRVLGGEAERRHAGLLVLDVPKDQLSEVIGPGQSNLRHWREKYGLDRVRVNGSHSISANGFQCRWVRQDANLCGHSARNRL